MQKVVQLSLVKHERRLSVEEAWERFVERKNRSKETLVLEDGIAAGKAYREFLEACARSGL
jgi:hypothetical protein